MSLVRGILLAGQFRSQHDLDGMSEGDQRNTLIVELSNRTNQPVAYYQALDDYALAGAGAILVFLRQAHIRSDSDLKAMSDEDMRNTLIVELDVKTHKGFPILQSLSSMNLVLQGLGQGDPAITLIQPTYMRGVLLAGQFRSQHDLDGMSDSDQRNTLIVELSNRTNQPVAYYQALDDYALAGAGAILVFLRQAHIRSDSDLKAMSDEDMRNTLIVEIEAQTHLGSRLQDLINIDLVRLGLGVDPAAVFQSPRPPLQPPPTYYLFNIDSVEIQNQRADTDHSDSDWLSIIVTVANPVTKNVQTFPAKMHHVGDGIKSGNILNGPFSSDPINAGDTDVVVINYMVTNLGSSNAEEQFAQAVKVTNQVVGVVGPVAGAAIGFFVGDPAEGLKIGQEIAKGFNTVISTLSDVFDFLDIHSGPPNCNGEVLHDTLTFQPHELAQAIDQLSSREYTVSQQNARCGAPPKSVVHFSVRNPRL